VEIAKGGSVAPSFKLPDWSRAVIYFIVVVLLLGLAWEGYKLLAAPGGRYLLGTAEVKVGDERVPGVLCQSLGLCKIALPVSADDRTMPHLSDIVGTLFEPPRRGGEEILLTILIRASLFTLLEAVVGFILGGTLGFILGVVFAH
jgi:NitT/TauT family transport system permease protein